MKHINRHFGLALVVSALLSTGAVAVNWTADMKEGPVTFKSMGPLCFGPDGIIFVADTKAAAITAIDTGDTKAAASEGVLQVKGISQKIAALLGTPADQLLINDQAVNPTSHRAYLAVSAGRGPNGIP